MELKAEHFETCDYSYCRYLSKSRWSKWTRWSLMCLPNHSMILWRYPNRSWILPKNGRPFQSSAGQPNETLPEAATYLRMPNTRRNWLWIYFRNKENSKCVSQVPATDFWWFCGCEWELILCRGEGMNLRENISQVQNSHFCCNFEKVIYLFLFFCSLLVFFFFSVLSQQFVLTLHSSCEISEITYVFWKETQLFLNLLHHHQQDNS